ncbi:MAG TPA: hypothetical protein VG055_08615 [Planctomycetaceae bacterium]|jgi:hypothetical protein|nr:hypothetical protein [Planctomycetaceae bacterium]
MVEALEANDEFSAIVEFSPDTAQRLGCRGWFAVRVTTLGELDAVLARAAAVESASYIEVVAGSAGFPAGLAMADQRLDARYANDSSAERLRRIAVRYIRIAGRCPQAPGQLGWTKGRATLEVRPALF